MPEDQLLQPRDMVDVEQLGENGFLTFFVCQIDDGSALWHGVMSDRRTGKSVSIGVARSAQKRQAAERLVLLANDPESRLGGVWTSQQVEFFDRLSRHVEVRGPQHVSRPLLENVPEHRNGVAVECPLCQRPCWKRSFEPPIYPEGVQAVCTICATSSGGPGHTRLHNKIRRCGQCGCTQDDCSQCIERTGKPCHWVKQDLCSACVEVPA